MTKAQKSRANHTLCLYKAELADAAPRFAISA